MTTYLYEYLENVEPGERGGASLAIFDRYSTGPGASDPYCPGDKMCRTFFGTIEADEPDAAAWAAFQIHNRDDRPTARVARSMCDGDVVRVWTPERDVDVYLALGRDGFVPVDEPTSVSIDPVKAADTAALAVVLREAMSS